MEDCFQPAFWARNPHLQTVFASLKIRACGVNEMSKAGREMVVDAGGGVRLLGFHSPQPRRPANGLVVLLHGWEGSADSTYILSAGRFLFRRGYDIFRLNLRDHGKSHHLNRELFHGALTEETAEAVRRIAGLSPDGPCYLVGFSLGANFALRIALRQSAAPIPQLKHVFCVSPTLDPYKSTLAIDEGPSLYRRYYLAKWKRSLREKERCFPDLYRFEPILHLNTCMALTEAIMPWYSEFPNYLDYFRLYTLTGAALAPLAMPVTIFASLDDPVVPAGDYRWIPESKCLKIHLERYGGHCGFLDPFPSGCWYERMIGGILSKEGG